MRKPTQKLLESGRLSTILPFPCPKVIRFTYLSIYKSYLLSSIAAAAGTSKDSTSKRDKPEPPLEPQIIVQAGPTSAKPAAESKEKGM